MEGCRYPMPWSRDIPACGAYQLVHTMAHLKAAHKALRRGGMKFLYAEGRVIALARFWEDEVFVGILSQEQEDVTIRLPLGAVGASALESSSDIFGTPLVYRPLDSSSIELEVKAGQSYLFACR